MAQDVELNEPPIDVFKSTNINAIQRVLDRAQRNADKAAKAQRRDSKPARKAGALTKALNAAMAAYGRSGKNRASIRLTAPNTGGRPYHFAYSHVTKGERRSGKAADGGSAGTAGTAGNGKAPAKQPTGKTAGAGSRGRPKANTAEAAHQVYTERDAAVDKDAHGLSPDLAPVAPSRTPADKAAERDDAGPGQDAEGPDRQGPPGRPDDRRSRRPGEIADAAGLAQAYAEGLVAEGQGVTERASAAAAQAYIEDPSKRLGALMGTTASFGTIGATLEERMAFWDLVHEHESAKGGRTQSRLVLELPHEAMAEDRHEIVRRYTDEFRRKGTPFWASIHALTAKNDARNHHAHVVFTDRPMRKMPHPETGELVWDFTVEQTYIKKNRTRVTHHPYRQNRDPEMRDRGYVKLARSRFSTIVNEVMQQSGNAVRYDPRSYKDMGLGVAPMKNVTRILADKLDKRAFVVMDAEWTRRMVDAEVKAAAARRDRTFLKLQEAEQRLQEAARNVRAANKANARLPRHLRLTPGQVVVQGMAQRIMGKILTVRRDRLATQFMDEATLSALRQVAEATSPNQGRTRTTRAHDPATAPDPEDLAALHAAALEEIEAQRLGARSRRARADAREAELTKDWETQGLSGKRWPQGATPTGPTPGGPTGGSRPPQPGVQVSEPAPVTRKAAGSAHAPHDPHPPGTPTARHGIHLPAAAHSPAPARTPALPVPAWRRHTTASWQAPQDETPVQIRKPTVTLTALQRLSAAMRVRQGRLDALVEQYRGDGAGFTAAVLAEHQQMIDQHRADRARLNDLVPGAEEVRRQAAANARPPALVKATHEPAPLATAPDAMRVMHRARIPDRPPPSLERDPRPVSNRGGSTLAIVPGASRTGQCTGTRTSDPYQSRASTTPSNIARQQPPMASTPGEEPKPETTSDRVEHAGWREVSHDPQAGNPPTDAANLQPGQPVANDKRDADVAAPPPDQVLATRDGRNLTAEEIEAEQRRRKRRRAILAAQRRSRGPGL